MVKFEQIPDRPIEAGGLSRAETTNQGLFANRIVAEGAILTLAGTPITRFLVGYFKWLDPRRIFWFTAYGDSAADGHLLEFDQTRANETHGISFAKDGRTVAHLTRIEHAGVEDPDDFRIAWQLWQEVAPLRSAMIEGAFASLTGERLDGSGDEEVRVNVAGMRRGVSARA